MKTISLKVSETFDRRLTRVARRRRWSKSQLVRAALDEFLLPSRSRPTEFFLKHAPDQMGIVDGGPGDLSTDKRHLEALGR
jgi:hypothetical protein